MEIQAFNDERELCFRTKPEGFVYRRLLTYLDKSPVRVLLSHPDQDFQLTESDQSVLLAGISNDIDAYKETLRSGPPADLPPNHLSEVTIKGEKLFLYPLFDSHRELIELGRLFDCIEKTLEIRSSLRVFVVPDLTSVQFRLLVILKQAPAGIEQRLIGEALTEEYQRLIHSDVMTEELKSNLESDLNSLSAPAVIEENLLPLVARKLVAVDNAGTIRATEKLLSVRI